MALLSQLIRNAAITGDTGDVNAWFADRQGRQWTERTIRAAFPPGPRPDRPATLDRLGELRDRGVVTGAEFDTLRARLRV